MIQVKGLTKIFPSGLRAVDGLDLAVEQGDIVGLLGPNGAGKTTTIRVLATLSGFDSGSVRVAGHDIDKDPQQVREAIGVVAQQTGIDYFLTGRENLTLQGQLYRMPRSDIRQRIDELAGYFGLADSLDRLVSTYSGGMRRKLDIAAALIHRPRLVFLDEPTLGLDIESRRSLWNYIEKLNREFGLTILLTTHYLEETDNLAHRVAIINSGRIQVVGTPGELKRSVQGDSVVLEFNAPDDPCASEFATAVRAEPFITDVVWELEKLHLYVGNGAASVPRIMQIAAERNAAVKTLSFAQPTLDDVFLKYTGTSITADVGGSEADEWWKQWAGKSGGKWQKNRQNSAPDGAPQEQVDGDWQKWRQRDADVHQGEPAAEWQKWSPQNEDNTGAEHPSGQQPDDWQPPPADPQKQRD